MIAPEENKTYEVECPSCGRKSWAYPSIFHMMGLFDLGSGNCPGCNLHLNLVYLPDEGRMKSRPYDEWREERLEAQKEKVGKEEAEV